VTLASWSSTHGTRVFRFLRALIPANASGGKLSEGTTEGKTRSRTMTERDQTRRVTPAAISERPHSEHGRTPIREVYPDLSLKVNRKPATRQTARLKQGYFWTAGTAASPAKPPAPPASTADQAGGEP
jgi:hypothetical protein